MANSEVNVFRPTQLIPDAQCYKKEKSVNFNKMLPSGDNANMNLRIRKDSNALKNCNQTIGNGNKEAQKRKRKIIVLADKNQEFDNQNVIHKDKKCKRHSSGVPRRQPKLQSQPNSRYDSKKSSPFDLLSDEIVIKILEFLPPTMLLNGFALTCKRLRNICYDDTFWKRVDLGGKKFGPGQAGKIMLRGTKILRMAKAIVQPPLFLNDAEKYDNQHFLVKSISASMCETCVLSNTHGSSMELKLNYLDLSSSTIEETCLESLFEKCYNLKKVSLENCKLNDKILYFLAKNKNLEVLNLTMAVGITACGLNFLAQGLQNTLMDLNFSWIGMTEDMMDEALELLDNNSQTLRSLNIAGCKEVLTVDRLHFIIDNCSNIEELDISDAKALTSPSIEMIAWHLKHIKGLSASRCYGIAPLDFLELKKCADLKYLDVFGGMSEPASMELMEVLKPVKINKRKFSFIARPTVGTRCTSIWNEKTRYLAL